MKHSVEHNDVWCIGVVEELKFLTITVQVRPGNATLCLKINKLSPKSFPMSFFILLYVLLALALHAGVCELEA